MGFHDDEQYLEDIRVAAKLAETGFQLDNVVQSRPHFLVSDETFSTDYVAVKPKNNSRKKKFTTSTGHIYVKAKDLTSDCGWNNFYPETWAAFKKTLKPAFVDLINEECWTNSEDTVVILLHSLQVHPLELASLIKDLHPSELDYIDIGQNLAIVRFWWD